MDHSGKVIASFELTFFGSFPNGNALAALINNDMLNGVDMTLDVEWIQYNNYFSQINFLPKPNLLWVIFIKLSGIAQRCISMLAA